MKRVILSTAVVAFAGPCFAQAASVYPGCAVPAAKPNHHTFYIDPSKGSSQGDGSAAKPWRTLEEVLNPANKLISSKAHNARTFAKGDAGLVDVNPGAPVKAGDTLMLMSGDHGSPKLQNLYNPDFISIIAAPGQTPLVRSLSVVSAGKWLFQGLKFQGESPAASTSTVKNKVTDQLVNVGRGDWLGATADIVLADNSLSSTDDTSAWSSTDWILRPYSYGVYVGSSATCTTFSNNHFYNLFNAIVLSGDNSVFDKNTIEYMANDGIDVIASNLRVTRNLIQNGVNDATVDPLHADGIQGWSQVIKGVVQTNKNVLIDSNVITKTGNPDLTYMQGISVFDGKWDGLTISNNVVSVNVWHGIAVLGAKNTKIVNNTVMASEPAKHPSWIMARPSKDGLEGADGTIIRNNISTSVIVTGGSVSADHNIVAREIQMPVGGKPTTVRAGKVGDSNKVVPGILAQFQSFDPAAKTFDFRLRAGSAAIGYGTPTGAPLVDITGAQRAPHVSAGAYNQ